MIIDTWAKRWNLPPEAVAELATLLRYDGTPDAPEAADGHSEAYVQSVVRLEAAQLGAQLWRNNVGAGMMSTGSFIRFGLANESERMNKVIKSADLIGWYPVKIKQHHVGKTLGVFLSVENKRVNWTYRGDEREEAQLKWRNHVLAAGGIADFINGPGQLKTVLTNAVNKL